MPLLDTCIHMQKFYFLIFWVHLPLFILTSQSINIINIGQSSFVPFIWKKKQRHAFHVCKQEIPHMRTSSLGFLWYQWCQITTFIESSAEELLTFSWYHDLLVLAFHWCWKCENWARSYFLFSFLMENKALSSNCWGKFFLVILSKISLFCAYWGLLIFYV